MKIFPVQPEGAGKKGAWGWGVANWGVGTGTGCESDYMQRGCSMGSGTHENATRKRGPCPRKMFRCVLQVANDSEKSDASRPESAAGKNGAG